MRPRGDCSPVRDFETLRGDRVRYPFARENRQLSDEDLGIIDENTDVINELAENPDNEDLVDVTDVREGTIRKYKEINVCSYLHRESGLILEVYSGRPHKQEEFDPVVAPVQIKIMYEPGNQDNWRCEMSSLLTDGIREIPLIAILSKTAVRNVEQTLQDCNAPRS